MVPGKAHTIIFFLARQIQFKVRCVKGLLKILLSTPPKINIAPEKWWLEDYFPIGKAYFQGG